MAGKKGQKQHRYNRALADEICRRMSEGEAVNEICRDDTMPSAGVVRGWALDDLDGFYARYARARGLQAQHKFDRMIEVAEDGFADHEVELESGRIVLVHEAVARSRLIVDTLKWQASKLLPKEYGEKATTVLSNPDGSPIVPEGGMVQLFTLPDNGRTDNDSSGSDQT